MIKINFNTPVPYEQRDATIRAMKELGFVYERIYQNGTYSLHRFWGHLPSYHDEDISIHFIDDRTREEFRTRGKSDTVEIFLSIERKPQ